MKQTVSLVFIMACLLTACSSPTPPPPTETPIPPPTNTPIPPTPTPEPTATATPDPLLFRDDFDGKLNDVWSWTNQDDNFWSLTNNPGWLEIFAGPGGVPDGSMKNILLQPIPSGNFELETRVQFKPEGNFQIAGLMIYESGANSVIFGRAFCGACPPKDGYYFDMYFNGQWGGDHFGTPAPETDTVSLRLRREGSAYTSYASTDGIDWQVIGTHTTEMNPGFVGLIAGQAVQSEPSPARFDYFTITALP